MTSKQHSLSGGRVAAIVARGCMGKDKEECTVDFALGLLHKENQQFEPADIEKAKPIVERVLKEVVSKETTAEALEAWAAKVEGQEEPFNDKSHDAGEGNGVEKAAVATKAQLQAAVKTLGMGPSAYKGLSKDDPAKYCEELQRRVMAYVNSVSSEKYETLPSTEELEEMKKAAEAKKELSSLDASNIIQGRPKRRAASSAAEAIKRDIARDLEREAAQAASEPQQKKAKTDRDNKEASAAAASSSKSKPTKAEDTEKEEEEEEEEDEDSDEEESGSDGSDDSSGSGSSDDDDNDDDEEEDDEEE